MFASSQAEVQHGISIPLLLQLLDGKPLEEFLLALEITLEGGNQQRLAETAWSAQEGIPIGYNFLAIIKRSLMNCKYTSNPRNNQAFPRF